MESTSWVLPCSMISPDFITATRSHSLATTPKSCVITSIDTPDVFIFSSSFKIKYSLAASTAVVISSAIISFEAAGNHTQSQNKRRSHAILQQNSVAAFFCGCPCLSETESLGAHSTSVETLKMSLPIPLPHSTALLSSSILSYHQIT